jgi:hypothetical protein
LQYLNFQFWLISFPWEDIVLHLFLHFLCSFPKRIIFLRLIEATLKWILLVLGEGFWQPFILDPVWPQCTLEGIL